MPTKVSNGQSFKNPNVRIVQVAYERVNLADIETSSDEDDYGDLFAHVSWEKDVCE